MDPHPQRSGASIGPSGAPVPAERHMKGVVVSGLVRFLRKHRRSRGLPSDLDLSDEAEELLFGPPIVPSVWYQYDAYLELMRVVFDHVLGRDLEALAGFSGAGAPHVFADVHRALIEPGRPDKTIRNLGVHWELCHDFGAVSVESAQNEATVDIRDWDQMSELEGTLSAGWIGGILTTAGARYVRRSILERPWPPESSPRLRILYRWS